MRLLNMPRYRTTLPRLLLAALACAVLSGATFQAMQAPCERRMRSYRVRADGYPVRVLGRSWARPEHIARLQYVYYCCGAVALFVGVGLGLAALDRKWLLVGGIAGGSVCVATVVIATWVAIWHADISLAFIVGAVPLPLAVLGVHVQGQPWRHTIAKGGLAGLCLVVLYFLGTMGVWWIVHWCLETLGLLNVTSRGPLQCADGGWLMFGTFAGYHLLVSGYIIALLGAEMDPDRPMGVLWPFLPRAMPQDGRDS
ncbi:MAG: hypothetical protein ACYS9X_28495 [Planctomycetota bacterium]|jgi:hypothetical protein